MGGLLLQSLRAAWVKVKSRLCLGTRLPLKVPQIAILGR
jgi:hypothetical protein